MENLVHGIRYRKFAISFEKIGLFHLPHLAWNLAPLQLSEQLLTANNIFKATHLNYFRFNEGIEKVPFLVLV